MRSIPSIIIAAGVFVFSCKAPQQTQEPTVPPVASNTQKDAVIINNGEAEVAITPDQKMQNSKDLPYRIIVSFISIGEGTDRNATEILNGILNNWKTNQKTDIIAEEIHWGREGEVDFCFQLNEMTDAQQDQFINELKEKFKGHNLVQFAENEPCRHKR